MRIGILTRNRNSWSSAQLQESLSKRGIPHPCFSFSRLMAHVGYVPQVEVGKKNLLDKLNALIVRPIGRGSLEELVFRMDMLYRLQRLGLAIINPPEAIEHCVDKYDVLALLEENKVSVPRTAATENCKAALKAFTELGGDVIVKPIFGSRGIGATRIRDAEIATTIFNSIAFYHNVMYLQEFIDHGFSDIRAFVIGGRVVAAMRRMAGNWKTNYSQGASPVRLKLDKVLEDLAIKSASVVGCKIAGVDIVESDRGSMVLEVNSQPGWKGLQSVSNINIADEIVEFVVRETDR